MWIDTHCHLAWKEYDSDRAEVMARARESGVDKIIVIGAGNGLEGNERALQLVKNHDNLWAAVGIHPHDVKIVQEERVLPASGPIPPTSGGDPTLRRHPLLPSNRYIVQLRTWAQYSKVVAIGEIGLDYHYDHSPRDIQQQVFAEQLQLAKELNLPVAIHSRDAWDDTIRMVRETLPPRGGVFHCFGGTIAEAKQALDLGFFISISGIITFQKKVEHLVEVVKTVPLDRIVIETDAPFLAPVPHRGKRNEPAFVCLVGEKIAEIRKMPVEEVSGQICQNVQRLFGI